MGFSEFWGRKTETMLSKRFLSPYRYSGLCALIKIVLNVRLFYKLIVYRETLTFNIDMKTIRMV